MKLLTYSEIQALSASTTYSSDEILELHQRFLLLSNYRDTLSLESLDATTQYLVQSLSSPSFTFASYLRLHQSGSGIRLFFDTVKADSGVLTTEALVQYLVQTQSISKDQEPETRAQVSLIFNTIDSNATGLTYDLFQSAVEQQHKSKT